MRTKTLHSKWEWKLIAGDELERMNALQFGGYRMQDPTYLAHLERQREAFAPYIKASMRKTRQGILLDIIRSDAPREIVQQALWLYRGFRKGFNALVRMTQEENDRLLKECPAELTDNYLIWSAGDEQYIEALVEQFGWMHTNESHAYLMKLATGNVHPLVRAVAINAMAFEDKRFDADFVLGLISHPKTSRRDLYEALYAIGQHSDRYKGADYCPAIWPFVKHPDWHIYYEAIRSIHFKYGGRQRLRKYLASLKSGPNPDQKRIEEIESYVVGWEYEDAEIAERIKARKEKEMADES